MPLCCPAVELLPWQAAEHLLGGFTSRGAFQAVNERACKNSLCGSPWECPRLAHVETTKCPEMLGSSWVLAATSGAEPMAGASPIPSSACAGQWSRAVMEEEHEHNRAKHRP